MGKEGAQRDNYAGQRGYHPLLVVAAGTGDVLMARLRQGRANTARGVAHFLRVSISRVRYAGATGQLTVRADSGFYTHSIVAVCRDQGVRFSITVRQHQSVRNIIEAIPETDWTTIPYWMEGAADVAETEYIPFGSEPDAAPVRLIVRRVKPTPGSQLALFTTYSYHAFITDREGDTLDLETDHRRHAEVENAIRDLKYGVGLNHLPSGRFPANAAWLAVQVIAHPPLAEHVGPHVSVSARRWLPPRHCDDASSPWPDASPAKPAASPCICPRAGPGETISAPPSLDCAPCRPFLIAPRRLTIHQHQHPRWPARPAPGPSLIVSGLNLPDDLALRHRLRSSTIPCRGSHDTHPAEWLGNQRLTASFPRLSSLT